MAPPRVSRACSLRSIERASENGPPFSTAALATPCSSQVFPPYRATLLELIQLCGSRFDALFESFENLGVFFVPLRLRRDPVVQFLLYPFELLDRCLEGVRFLRIRLGIRLDPGRARPRRSSCVNLRVSGAFFKRFWGCPGMFSQDNAARLSCFVMQAASIID